MDSHYNKVLGTRKVLVIGLMYPCYIRVIKVIKNKGKLQFGTTKITLLEWTLLYQCSLHTSQVYRYKIITMRHTSWDNAWMLWIKLSHWNVSKSDSTRNITQNTMAIAHFSSRLKWAKKKEKRISYQCLNVSVCEV